jgi:hypothetical protein
MRCVVNLIIIWDSQFWADVLGRCDNIGRDPLIVGLTNPGHLERQLSYQLLSNFMIGSEPDWYDGNP